MVYKRCGCIDEATGRQLGRRCDRLADQEHGSWYFAAQVDGLSGRRERIRRGGYATANEARQAWRDMIPISAEQAAGNGYTVARWLNHWLETHQGLRPNTRKCYADHVRLHLIPHLGRIDLGKLTSRDVARMFSALAQRRTRYGVPIAASTLHRIRATLRAALNTAIREGLLQANPARLVRLPSPRRPYPVVWTDRRIAAWQCSGERPAVAVWTTQHLAEFLDFVRSDRLYPMWWLIALRGLRRGEAAALRWVDLDLDRHELTVTQQLMHTGQSLITCPPKSDASHRTIALDTETSRLLRRHERKERQRLGSRWSETSPVFAAPDGNWLRPDHLTTRFHALVRASGLPPIRLHDLRHGAATLALAAGTNLKVVQHTLGHSSIVVTADTYTSVLPETYHHAATATAQLVIAQARRTARKARTPAACSS
ncbi:tyrosine-type recombinase/integrase [Spongiactinospora rosea]|uniref:tyrosine-type recombinase/integrase n=1 Tax=Spongiactinospora rosea TaxID=2248750 RepID=UPI0013143BDA|nr:site-specific integrase [Spongiactinospora rosea]